MHVFESDNPEIERHLKFRDWMRTHPNDKEAYARLKQDLAHQFSNDSLAYSLSKDEFIANIDHQAGFTGLRVVNALTPREWNAVRHFRQFYFFDKAGLEDPYTWTFNHDAHVHFVLYQGVQIRGYAHLQRWPKGRAAMRILVIEELLRNNHYGSQFLKFCERWLKSQGYQSLQMESSQEALGFYRKNGYGDMPFNDPDQTAMKVMARILQLAKY